MRFIFFIIYLFCLAYSLSNHRFAKKNRRVLLIVLIAVFIFVNLVNVLSQESENRIDQLDRAFSSNKELICNDNLVTNKFYNLNRNTMSFISKKEIGSKILIFDIRDCREKNE